MLRYITLIILSLSIGLVGCESNSSIKKKKKMDSKWNEVLEQQIKLLGHRNWIVVVDAAYPLQSSAGINTILSDQSHSQTIKSVVDIIDNQKHIKPIVYLDKEIDFIEENSAEGISQFRKSLTNVLGNNIPQKILHEQLIAKLDKASKQFNITIIKTNFTVPYTSVFFELDCKYWNSEAEQKLRSDLEKAHNNLGH